MFDGLLNEVILAVYGLTINTALFFLKQNTRKNLAAVDNTKGPNKGKLHFRTAGGLINFIINESGDFAAQNNTHKLSEEYDFVQKRNKHIHNSDCVLQKDLGKWALNMDCDYVNLRLNVIDYANAYHLICFQHPPG